jgi:hypothetical protein
VVAGLVKRPDGGDAGLGLLQFLAQAPARRDLGRGCADGGVDLVPGVGG